MLECKYAKYFFHSIQSLALRCDINLAMYLYFRGHNVLDNKTELQKAMEKRNFKAKDKERKVSEETEKTPFQKMLEERAKRLEQVEIDQNNIKYDLQN